MRYQRRWGLGLIVSGMLLSACGGQPADEPRRPVLAVQPTSAAMAAGVFSGEVHAREESVLSFRIAGKLIRREVDAGARVRRGQVLALLDPEDASLQASAAQAQLAAAEADLVRIRGDLQRYEVLLQQKLVSQSAYDAQAAAFKAAKSQADAARAQLEVARNQTAYSQLRASDDGVIASRQAEVGQVVAAGQAVFTLAADSGREVLIALPEAHIRQFQVGQPAQVELWSAPDRRLPARIREISPAADAQTRTYAARVALEGDAAQAVDLGQSARVRIGDETAAVLQVPLTAIQRGEDGRASVWVIDPKDSALHARLVELGPFGDEQVPVLAGLQAGDWIVAAGGHLLREGQAVTAVDRRNRPVQQVAVGNPE